MSSCCENFRKPGVTNHVTNLRDCVIIIKNVPCLRCEKCGETAYNNETEANIETILEELFPCSPELAIINYPDRIA